MFKTENRIGFRFGRDSAEVIEAEERATALRSAMQASGQRSGMPAPRPVVTEPLGGSSLPTSPDSARPTEPTSPSAPTGQTGPIGPRPSDEDSMLSPTPTRADERALLPVIAQARAVIGQGQTDEEGRALDAVLKTIDSIAARQMEMERELRLARDTAAKATADRARLAEENQQMRDLLSSLLKTIEAERRRRSDTVTRIGDRLKSLSATLADTAGMKSEAA